MAQNNSTQAPTVVVTGASTGIGWGTTKILLQKGFTVFGSVRKQADADRLQAEFGSAFHPLLMDVTDAPAVREAARLVASYLGNRTLAGLVNNAGIVVAGPLLHLPAAEYRHQLEVNVIGPLTVTQAFAPLLGATSTKTARRTGQPGRIVNISSVGGKLGYPLLGPYIASKHALEGFSESLRREMLLYGIDVILIGPGSVATPIWDKAESDDFSLYAQTDYATIIEAFKRQMIDDGRKGFPPEVIGEAVHTALTTAKPRTRYAVVPQRLTNWTIPNLLPKRLVDRLIGKRFGFLPSQA